MSSTPSSTLTVNSRAAGQLKVDLASSLALAANPATSPKKLRALALRHDSAVDELLALNPNTPGEILDSLLCKYPLAALANPIFTYRVFSEAEPLHKFLALVVQARLYLALREANRQADIDTHLPATVRSRWVWRDTQPRLVQDLSPADYLKFAHCLVTDASPDIRAEAWRLLPFATSDLAAHLMPDIASIVQNPRREPEVLALLGNYQLPDTACELILRARSKLVLALAKSAYLGSRYRKQLLRSPNETIAKAAALASIRHSSIPMARMLYGTGRRRVRIGLAQAPGAGPSHLRPVLAADPDSAVRRATALYLRDHIGSHDGPGISRSLETLARDSDAAIRALVAGDHRLEYDTIQLLSRDPDAAVRQEVLAHHRYRTLSDCGLLSEKCPHVRRQAAITILDFDNLYNRGRELSAQIARDPSPGIRARAAAYRHRSAAALEILAQDSETEVQKALAGHAVRWRVLSPASLAWAGLRPTAKKALRRLSRSRNAARRALAATITRAGSRCLNRLSTDPCWFVRYAVTQNNRVSVQRLERLAADSHRLVSLAAREKLAKLRPAIKHIS